MSQENFLVTDEIEALKNRVARLEADVTALNATLNAYRMELNKLKERLPRR